VLERGQIEKKKKSNLLKEFSNPASLFETPGPLLPLPIVCFGRQKPLQQNSLYLLADGNCTVTILD
jgi:hypothetical protein